MSRDRRSEERGPSEAPPVTRRAFLQLAGAAAAAGSSGCFQMPPESAMPATQPVEGRTPGRPQSFATAWPYQGAGIGLLVQSWEGRPTKVEGNPLHLASLGAAGVFEQALVLQLYDAQRPSAPEQPTGASGEGAPRGPQAAPGAKPMMRPERWQGGRRLIIGAAALGAAGLAATLVGFGVETRRALYSYLFAWFYWGASEWERSCS
jgi:hypothetical protein